MLEKIKQQGSNRQWQSTETKNPNYLKSRRMETAAAVAEGNSRDLFQSTELTTQLKNEPASHFLKVSNVLQSCDQHKLVQRFLL